jgi:2-keto-3-deoxy-6-phosphogluconate aldolase
MIPEPLPYIPLVPIEGVNLETLIEYLEAGARFVGAGGDLINKEVVKSREIDLISEGSRQYILLIEMVRTKTEQIR